jgi:hypothetical protein
MEKIIKKLKLVEKGDGYYDDYYEIKVLNEDKSLALTFDSLEQRSGYSLVDPTGMDRRGSTAIRDIVTSKWKYSTKDLEGCGNLHNDTFFDVENGSFVFINDYTKQPKWDDTMLIRFYRVISSHLLMYRLCATFFKAPKVFDGYKMIWNYNLEHKVTGKKFSFGEWKGGPGFWLNETESSQLPEDFRNDMIELINYLISDQCSHPYDGCTAGQIA